VPVLGAVGGALLGERLISEVNLPPVGATEKIVPLYRFSIHPLTEKPEFVAPSIRDIFRGVGLEITSVLNSQYQSRDYSVVIAAGGKRHISFLAPYTREGTVELNIFAQYVRETPTFLTDLKGFLDANPHLEIYEVSVPRRHTFPLNGWTGGTLRIVSRDQNNHQVQEVRVLFYELPVVYEEFAEARAQNRPYKLGPIFLNSEIGGSQQLPKMIAVQEKIVLKTPSAKASIASSILFSLGLTGLDIAMAHHDVPEEMRSEIMGDMGGLGLLGGLATMPGMTVAGIPGAVVGYLPGQWGGEAFADTAPAQWVEAKMGVDFTTQEWGKWGGGATSGVAGGVSLWAAQKPAVQMVATKYIPAALGQVVKKVALPLAVADLAVQFMDVPREYAETHPAEVEAVRQEVRTNPARALERVYYYQHGALPGPAYPGDQRDWDDRK